MSMVSKRKSYKKLEISDSLLEERRSPYGLRTYISLFSSAGVGCYGFKQENEFHYFISADVPF